MGNVKAAILLSRRHFVSRIDGRGRSRKLLRRLEELNFYSIWRMFVNVFFLFLDLSTIIYNCYNIFFFFYGVVIHF